MCPQGPLRVQNPPFRTIFELKNFLEIPKMTFSKNHFLGFCQSNIDSKFQDF